MIGIIAAISEDGVFTVEHNGKFVIPWNYPDDLKFFKKTTMGGTVIMGRNTYEDIGKPLPNRTNIVVSSKMKSDSVKVCSSIQEACQVAVGNAWLIGGEQIFQEALSFADVIYLTLIPKSYIWTGVGVKKFPWINPTKFVVSDRFVISKELDVLVYKRI